MLLDASILNEKQSYTCTLIVLVRPALFSGLSYYDLKKAEIIRFQLFCIYPS